MILSRATGPQPEVQLEHCWYAVNITDAQYETFASMIGAGPASCTG